MFLDKFFKKQFISFYKDENYNLLFETIKNKKVIESEKKEFEEKKDLEKFVKEKIEENPQTYVSSVLLTLNQGVLNSCSKKKYLEKDIDYDNIKIVCINKAYSFYASIYDISAFLKEYKFPIDFLYSIFAIIDYLAKERKNRFYVLALKNYLAILGFENYKPIYSDFIILNEESEENEEIEEIDDLEILDDIDEIEDNIEDVSEDIEDINEEELEEKLNTLTTNIEVNILNSLKNSIKDYYDNYSSDFIEKIIILDSIGLDIAVTSLIEDELLIPTELINIDLLKSINEVSIESI
jgi:hypothetical protein